MGRVHAYVDGFNLYYAIRRWKHLKWLEIRAFAEAFVDPGDALAHIYYFTAMVRPTQSDPDKPKRQIAYVNALESLSRVSVVKGNYAPVKRRCRRCQNWYRVYEEKTTDVAIGLRMLRDALESRCEHLMLISGDGDQSPTLKMIHELARQSLTVVLPPNLRNKEFARFGQRGICRIKIGSKKVTARCQLPDPVRDGIYAYHRPAEWT